MEEILTFILNYLDFLYKKYNFKFIDSNYSPTFGGDSYVILENEILLLRFVLDRNQLFLDFQSKIVKEKNHWYSIELIKQIINKNEDYDSILDSKNGLFLQNNFENIIKIFNNENIKTTLQLLKELEKKRAKMLFG